LAILIIYVRSFFLPLDTDSLSTSTGGLGVLTSHLESPLVSETPVAPDLEEPLDILSEFGFKDVGCDLEVLALLVVPLSVEEPSGDTVAFGVSDEASDSIALRLSELTGSELGVKSEDLADEEAEASTNSLDLVKSEGDSALAIDVGVEDTMDVLEGVLSVFDDQ
jgi:hypothetical protein